MDGSAEGRHLLGDFWRGIRDPRGMVERVGELMPVLKEAYPTVKRWAGMGFCWGGKIVSLNSASPDTPWSDGIQSSPARVDPADAERIGIPMTVLASSGEDEEMVREFGRRFLGLCMGG